MNKKASYQAANLVSKQIEEHFSRQIQTAKDRGETDLAHLPSAAVIESIIDSAFWASLRKEEGYSPKISIAYLPPDLTHSAILFKNPIEFNSNSLTKIAPGMARGGTYIGVWLNGSDLIIWGSTQILPNYCFVTDVSEPGLLIVKHRRIYGYGKFANVVVLKGEQIKYLVDKKLELEECPTILKSLLDVESPTGWDNSSNILIQLAVSMRAHGRGGSLVVIKTGDELWRNSVISPMSYPLSPSYKGLSKLMEREIGLPRSEIYWQTAVKKEIDYLAGLTAIDGATIITEDYELLGFGAKLTRAKGSNSVQEISLIEPIKGVQIKNTHPTSLGGTRHFSAAQFVYDQPNTIVLVASQDGHFTFFTWSEKFQRVYAYRLDSLLL